MNYFFLFLSIFCTTGLLAGSFGSKPMDESERLPFKRMDQIGDKSKKAKKNEQTIIQIVPVKGVNGGSSELLKGQLVKSAIRHITRISKYQLAFGKVLPKANGKTQVENLEITLLKVPRRDNYRLELRIFELGRNTLVKKVAQSKLMESKLLQQAELMFQELFLENTIQKNIIPE